MNKILYVATSDIHLATFHLPFLKWLKNEGFNIDIAAEKRGDLSFENVDKIYYLPFPRSPFNSVYIKTYKNLKKIIKEGNYNLIHCHTPLPSIITRLAARTARSKGTVVLYTAHGFHFYKDAPLINWFTYYPIEWLMSRYTDGIITMNKEDYDYVNHKMMHKYSFIIPGMGVNPNIFKPLPADEKVELRKKLGYSEKDILLLYVAEFIPRKNHKLIISALSQIKKKFPDLKVIFAGKGPLMENAKMLVRNKGLDKMIDFLGFRNDIPVLSGISDIGISSSRHEGLPIGILQEMFCGLPIVATVERGHNELVKHNENGFLCRQNDSDELAAYLEKLIFNKALRIEMGNKSLEFANSFSLEKSITATSEIYKSFLER